MLIDPVDVGWNTRVHSGIFRVGAAMRPRDQPHEFSIDGKRASGITLKTTNATPLVTVYLEDIVKIRELIGRNRIRLRDRSSR